MYKIPTIVPTKLNVNNCVEGETIEMKIERIVNNKEPIKDGAPLMYTERREGIKASTNIRTDRFEIAVEAADKISKSYKARREEKAKIGEPESTQGKDSKESTDPSKNLKVS
ncbi:MAG: hypothetical protein [Microviridae sp.]|nr:MAG: hypothetical protein [Microviridae sp.]